MHRAYKLGFLADVWIGKSYLLKAEATLLLAATKERANMESLLQIVSNHPFYTMATAIGIFLIIGFVWPACVIRWLAVRGFRSHDHVPDVTVSNLATAPFAWFFYNAEKYYSIIWDKTHKKRHKRLRALGKSSSSSSHSGGSSRRHH